MANSTTYPTTPENKPLAKKLTIAAWIITVAVLLLVGAMRRFKIPTSIDFTFIPPIIAIINTLVAALLIAGLIQIKKKNYQAHQKTMFAALMASALFLVLYVVYHFTTVETTYCKDDWTRTLYYVILFSHIVLAGLSFPFILLTFIKSYTGQFAAHRKLAKRVYPIWLYVAITGPITYLFLQPCYGL